jgi:uncharacterized membrane protein
MTPETSKILGAVGALLLFLGVVPVQYAGILSLVGLILLLTALYSFAGIYRERGIFNNFLFGILTGIVGAVVAVGVAIASVLTTLMPLLYALYPGWNGDWMALSGLTPDISGISPGDVLPLLGGLVIVFVIIWVALIIAAFLMRRSLNSLSAKAHVGLFSTAALLLLIGAFLAIVIVGLLLIWISMLLVAIAFFQMKTQPVQPAATMAPTSPTSASV